MQLILSGRKNFARIEEILPLPNLIQVQLDSFRWFQEEGLKELFEEISPIQSYNKVLELHFLDYEFGKPKYTIEECKLRDLTYAAPLWVKVRLVNNETGEIQEQRIFFGDFPLMTEKGTFVINGAERVVVNQLLRSPGVYFSLEEDRATGRLLCYAKLIPNRGAWLEFETSKRDVISVKIERKRKLPVTVLLRALGYGTDEELLALYEGVDTMPEHSYIKATIEADPTKGIEEALVEIYKRMRPGEPANPENARNYLIALFFNPRRYDLGKMGRYKLNRRLGLDIPLDHRTLTREDLVKVVEKMILINNGVENEDDIDHLGNRRVRTVGELVQNQMRVGLLRLERAIKERMSIKEPEEVTPLSLINIRPVVAALREFFGGSQLSQFMDQTNPLAELTHKRRVSALGPGGLKRERAGFEVRDVHNSHYGRICPIETPEGPNIGLIGSLATYAKVNDFGFMETPYRKVLNKVPNRSQDLVGHILRERIVDPVTGELIAEAGTEITPELADRISRLPYREIKIRPVVTNEIVYLSADEEDQYVIAQAGVPLDSKGHFLTDKVTVRHMQQFAIKPVDQVDYMDVSPKQIVSVSASLIPFLEHDDANRALMGSNMQRQAVPLVKPEAPLVSTGMEYYVAKDSGQIVLAEEDGEVVSVTSTQIVVKGEKGLRIYPLKRYQRSNQATCIDQRPIVSKGQKVKKGQVLADSSSTQNGELALGQNVLVAFISWEGGNYEDAVLVSEALVQEDIYTSIHIEEYETEAVDTKLGPEEITRDIPNVGEEVLRDLDENGIIRIGAQVGPGDILVGKITPKGETELSPEEKLLRAIFGERARDVRDTSLRMPHGERGVVISVAEFSRDQYKDLPAGVEKVVKVYVAQRRKLTEGDKMAGRHGNKGVISKIVPVEDMPFLPDGTPIEVILNPLGVPARMNLGQILETHLGWAAYRLGFKAITPVFDGADQDEVFAELARAWLIDKAWEEITERAWQWLKSIEYNPQDIEDDEEARRLYLVEWIGDRYDPERLMEDWNYARRSAFKEWLRERGYDPDAILIFEDDPRPLEARREADRLARLVCLREWMGSLTGEYPPLEGVSEEKLMEKAIQVSKATGQPVPTTGKMILYDGRTGEPYDQPVTVGVMMIMKLIHLVEDKVHARSTGPYSLVTQQPLGGKAQFGGQRFGEMEVWALEAYGAAHTLQEMLTVKSDDTIGRLKTYEAIVRGERVSGPEMPESFKVLVKELQSLGLSVEVYDAKGDKYTFGKEEREEKPIPLGFGSFDLARKFLRK